MARLIEGENVTAAKSKVMFIVESDAAAHTVRRVLEAVGFDVERRHNIDQGDTLPCVCDELHIRYSLTPMEKCVYYNLLADGSTNRAIAARLNISPHTFKWHLHNIYAKTGVASREGLLRLALLHGWAPQPPEKVPT